MILKKKIAYAHGLLYAHVCVCSSYQQQAKVVTTTLLLFEMGLNQVLSISTSKTQLKYNDIVSTILICMTYMYVVLNRHTIACSLL